MEFIIYHPIKRKYTNENKTFWCSAQVPSQINFQGIKVFETDKNLSAKSYKLLTFTKRLVHTTQFLVISSFSCTRTHILHWRYLTVIKKLMFLNKSRVERSSSFMTFQLTEEILGSQLFEGLEVEYIPHIFTHESFTWAI